MEIEHRRFHMQTWGEIYTEYYKYYWIQVWRKTFTSFSADQNTTSLIRSMIFNPICYMYIVSAEYNITVSAIYISVICLIFPSSFLADITITLYVQEHDSSTPYMCVPFLMKFNQIYHSLIFYNLFVYQKCMPLIFQCYQQLLAGSPTIQGC